MHVQEACSVQRNEVLRLFISAPLIIGEKFSKGQNAGIKKGREKLLKVKKY